MNTKLITDPDMELIHTDYCASLAYECFKRGFQEADGESGFRVGENSSHSEDFDYFIIFFEASTTNDGVIWISEAEGTLFDDFWLIFSHENKDAAESAFKFLSEYFQEELAKIGRNSPHGFLRGLDETFNSIWGKAPTI